MKHRQQNGPNVGQRTGKSVRITVYPKNEYDEYEVRVSEGNRTNPDATYYTPDKDDAFATARAMQATEIARGNKATLGGLARRKKPRTILKPLPPSQRPRLLAARKGTRQVAGWNFTGSLPETEPRIFDSREDAEQYLAGAIEEFDAMTDADAEAVEDTKRTIRAQRESRDAQAYGPCGRVFWILPSWTE